MKTIKLLFISALLVFIVQSAKGLNAFPNDGDISFGIIGDDVSLDEYADLLLPLAGNETSFLFLSPRLSMTGKSVLSSAENEFNLGIGYRKFFDKFIKGGFIAGANLYYDVRNSDIGKTYQQAGIGFEALSETADLRINYYYPFAHSYYHLSKAYNVFENHNIAATYYYELAAKGFDAELGYKIPFPEIMGDFRVFGGYYNFEADIIKKTYAGYKIRAEYNPITPLTLNFILYQDKNLTGSVWQAGASISVPLDFRSFLQMKNPFFGISKRLTKRTKTLKERITQPVWRDMRIRVYKETSKRFDDVVKDEEGVPYYFTVVSPSGTGDGTFARPANAKEAALLSKKVESNTAVLFFLDGKYDMYETTDLSGHKASNVLIAGAQELIYRAIDVSAISKETPVIRAKDDIALFKIDNWQSGNFTIAAIEFEGKSKTGVGVEVRNSTGNVSFENNSFSNFDAGIKIINSSVSGRNNIISSNATGVGVWDSDIAFEQNILSQNSREAFYINAGSNAFISSNLISENASGINIYQTQDAYIYNNEITNNSLYGVFSSSANGLIINANLISSNSLGAVFLEGNVSSVIEGNLISENYGFGARLLNSSGSLISANVITANDLGISVFNCDNVQIWQNEISSNSAAAIAVENANFFEASDNQILFNVKGIEAKGLFQSEFAFNEISSNAKDAINIDLSTSVYIGENSIENNGADAISISNSQNLYVGENTLAYNLGKGIFVQSSQGFYIEDNESLHNEYGIYILSSSYVNISTNVFYANANDAMSISDAFSGTVINNISQENLQNGGNFNNVADFYFELNTFALNQNAGVVFNDVFLSTFAVNRITGGKSDGLFLSNAADCVFSQNTIDENAGNGIIFSDGLQTKIQLNDIYKNGQTGILITSGELDVSDNAIIENNEGIRAQNVSSLVLFNNEVANSAAGGIYAENIAVSTISDNIVYENGGYGGIYVSSVSNMSLENNAVFDNLGNAITIYNADNSQIRSNVADNNDGAGIYINSLKNSVIYNNSLHTNDGYNMILKDNENVLVKYNGLYYDSQSGGLNIENSLNIILDTNVFQAYAVSGYFGLYLKDDTTFGVGSGSDKSGNNRFIGSNYYGGDASAVTNYETGVKVNGDEFR